MTIPTRAIRTRAIALATAALLLAGCTASPATDQTPVAVDPAGSVDIGHLDSKFPEMSNPEVDTQSYDLILDWDGTTLVGRATIKLRVGQDTPTLRLNLYHALEVTEASLDGVPVTWTADEISVTFDTGQLFADDRHTLVIDYAGTPQAAPIDADRLDMAAGLGWIEDPETGWVSTVGEPYGSLTYYPVNEAVWDEAYYTAQITAPPGMVAVFNGPLLAMEEIDGRTVTTWGADQPISPYLVVLAISNYQSETRDFDGTPYTIWWQPEFDHQVDEMWAASQRTWDWLTQRLGEYPFSTAGFVLTGEDSALETQGMISMGANVMSSYFEETLLHEMAHQWFGNAVTPADWRDLWLSEGWAMYLEAEYGDYGPPEAFGNWCASDVGQSGQAGDYKPTAFANDNVYVCPIPILAQIRDDVGDDAFWALAGKWASDNMNRNVTREEFRAFLQAETGTDYGPLFATWLDNVQPSR